MEDFEFEELDDIEFEMDEDLSMEEKKDFSSDKYGNMSGHPLYKKLAGMIDRCSNPKNKSYEYWGGKGIKVYKNWNSLSKFSEFYNWSIETGWKEGMELDRINPDKDYEPSNLQWLTKDKHALKTLNDQRRKTYFANPDQEELDL